MSLYGIEQQERAILQCILDHNPMTACDLLAYRQGETRWGIYYRLGKLEKRGFLSSFRLEPSKGASSRKLYRLTAKGARVVGEDHVAPIQYRYIRSDFYHYRNIKVQLQAFATQQNVILIEENEDARNALARCLANVSVRRGHPPAPEYIYSGQLPQKVTPDLVLTTPKESLLLLPIHPAAGSKAFQTRLDKYKRILFDVRFVCICPTERQTRQLQTIVDTMAYKHQFLVLGYDELDRLEQWIS